MAGAIVEILLKNLGSLMINSDLSSLWNAESELEKLFSSLKTIQAVLETKQITSKAVDEVWLKELKDAAYDADDILDEAIFQQPINDDSNKNEIHASLSSLKKKAKRTRLLIRITNKIKKIRKRFEQIADEKRFTETAAAVAVSDLIQGRQTTSLIDQNQIHGRDADVQNMVKLLLENSNDDDVSVIPILGMGGVGKTTLAQIVYNNESVIKHFDTRIWCYVSDDFDVKRLLRRVLEYITETPFPLQTLNIIQRELQQRLQGKRFLLVLDDVRNSKQELWNMFKNSLRSSGLKGSSIIITTRLQIVAEIVSPASSVYKLSSLRDGESWKLFPFYAFRNEGEQQNPNLLRIARQIIKKCGGVPLAIKVVGSLLYSEEQNERKWEWIRDNGIWDLQGREEKTIFDTFTLSYNCLSSPARQCFAYCSLYPKDYAMEKENLIQIWMANGFIPVDDGTEPEVAGDMIFNELLSNAMLEGTERDGDGDIVECKMHYLLHDFASLVSRELDSLRMDATQDGEIINENTLERARHLSVIGYSSELRLIHPSLSLQGLRTLMVFNNQVSFPVLLPDFTHLTCLRTLHLECVGGLSLLHDSLGKLKHLRYLDLTSCALKSLPKSFCKLRNLQSLNLARNDLEALPSSASDLKKLRYLNLSWNAKLTSLPESIGGLKSLQTLDLKHCHGLRALPASTTSLRSLKHLDTKGCLGLEGMPNGIGLLTDLQTLSYFKVGDEERGFAGIRDLQKLNLLKGGLAIGGLGHAKRLKQDGEGANLMHKPNLSRLELIHWYDDGEYDVNGRSSEEVLEGLQPHPKIKELEISQYPGAAFPTWMQMRDPLSSFPRLSQLKLCQLHNLKDWSLNWEANESLPALQSLKLVSCYQLKSLPEQICNLASLKSLSIGLCYNLVSLPLELFRLTSLETLRILRCTSLRSLPELGKQGKMSCLRSLEVVDCEVLNSRLEGLRHLTALETLQLRNCPDLKFSTQDLEHLTALKTLSVYPPMDLPEYVKVRLGLQSKESRNEDHEGMYDSDEEISTIYASTVAGELV